MLPDVKPSGRRRFNLGLLVNRKACRNAHDRHTDDQPCHDVLQHHVLELRSIAADEEASRQIKSGSTIDVTRWEL